MNETKQWPPSKAAFDELEGQLKYGAEFLWPAILPLLGFDAGKDKPTTWAFLGEWMKLVGMIEELGFIVTERGMHSKGFRLMQREEMADEVRNREKRQADASIKRSMILSAVPRGGLKEEEQARLNHVEKLSAILGATSKTLIARRKLPELEMAVKSVKQIGG